MKKSARILIFLLVFATIFSIMPVLGYTPNFEVKAEAAMLVNLDTETVLYSKNVHKVLYPASLTKVMTAVLTLENTDDVDKTVVTIPEYCLSMLNGTDSSMSGIKAGEKLTIRQLLYCMLMMSGNDVANVLADHIGGGDISHFIEMMNQKAEKLGMKDTNYVNAHGLHDEAHVTTAYDMMLLVSHAMTLPLFMEICSTSRYELPATNKNSKRTLSSSNLMMDSTSAYYYKYVKGVKTGFTDEAGRCLISTASKDGYRYLCIVMHCPPKDATGKSIRADFSDTENIYKWAFDTFEYKQVLSGTEPIAELKVDLSWDKDFVQLVPQKDLAAIIPKEANSSTILYNPKLDKTKVDAPVKKGDVYGTVELVYAGETIGTVNLVADESVQKSNILYWYKQIRKIFGSIWFQIGTVVLVLLIILLIILNIIQNKRRRRKRVRAYRRV